MEKCILTWWFTVVAVVIIMLYCTYSPDTINYFRVHTSYEELLV